MFEHIVVLWDRKKETTSLQTSCPDLAEFSAECKDSISPSIMAASRHSCRSLKPFTWRGYCPNISVFSNCFPVKTHKLTFLSLNKLRNVLHNDNLMGVISLFSGRPPYGYATVNVSCTRKTFPNKWQFGQHMQEILRF